MSNPIPKPAEALPKPTPPHEPTRTAIQCALDLRRYQEWRNGSGPDAQFTPRDLRQIHMDAIYHLEAIQ